MTLEHRTAKPRGNPDITGMATREVAPQPVQPSSAVSHAPHRTAPSSSRDLVGNTTKSSDNFKGGAQVPT